MRENRRAPFSAWGRYRPIKGSCGTSTTAITVTLRGVAASVAIVVHVAVPDALTAQSLAQITAANQLWPGSFS